MQRNDRWPEDYDPDAPKSRPGSRRNSGSLSRRSSVKKEKEGKKKSPLNSSPSSSNSTPKKVAKPQNLDFMVTGKQLLKRTDRANSLPGSAQRRPSTDSAAKKRPVDSAKRVPVTPPSSKSRETSLEDDMSLDLSQVSDFEDTNSKYGIKQKPLATSTPKSTKYHKPRSCSLQSHMLSQKMESSRVNKKKEDKRDSTLSSRDDSTYKSSSVSNRQATTELDYSSVSPEYSGQSSADLSPRTSFLTRDTDVTVSPRSQELQMSSCCLSSWPDYSDENTKVEDYRRGDNGEWNNFWANYNNSVAKVPMKTYYDQCPTPYRTENIDLADLDFSTEGSRKRSPDDMQNINKIIRTEGLHLTPRETQNIIKCAHILGNVLTKAIERRSKEKDSNEEKIQELEPQTEQPVPEVEIKKKTMTLDLKETVVPLEVKEEKRSETVMTQTDISLPNTKSAPRIFEKILRQLSKSSLEESLEKLAVADNKEKEEEKEVKKEIKEEEVDVKI